MMSWSKNRLCSKVLKEHTKIISVFCRICENELFISDFGVNAWQQIISRLSISCPDTAGSLHGVSKVLIFGYHSLKHVFSVFDQVRSKPVCSSNRLAEI